MQRRAEQIDETRQRITDAAIRLHTTVGPANTSIASIAAEADVTRLTVYRHFADLDAIFQACRGHWLSQNPPPDPEPLIAIDDLEERARFGLARLYGWFRAHADELYPINRDATSMPLSTQAALQKERESIGDRIVGGAHGIAGAPAGQVAVAHHLSNFLTWRSLAIEQGLADADAVDLAVRWLVAAGQPPERSVRPSGCRGAGRRRGAPRRS
jgi:AcrR family transcriptional regulator